ncbi:MAG: peptide chain release factor N(5)-glutamine methyltransferase [Pirellulales bacterium]|nr:peptide chain release factor N(5)-glutamine methyltransferase [Pirellulales bacterium]
MLQPESWTVGRLLEWTADYLKQRGADSPRLDAEVLLAEALGCKRIELYTAFSEVVDEGPRGKFRELVKRRAEGVPVAHLVGHREFYSLSFRVTPDVLIPRPETEFLVVKLLDLAAERKKAALGSDPIRICDIGTGSGIIAIAAAVHLPQAELVAVDVSRKALEVARENARDHGVEDRIEFIESDLFGAVPADRRFDFVVSNPPYISQSEMAELAPDVRDHEPQGALLGGEQGSEVIERLLPRAAERLLPGGHLLVEISPTIHDATLELIAATDGLQFEETVKDLARLPRVVRAVKC